MSIYDTLRMRTWLENKWQDLRANFWFVPAAMAFASVILFVVLVSIDTMLPEITFWPLAWVDTIGIEGVRMLLSSIVGAVVTTLGLVFSITIVALTLAASQLGPRLLRNFMQDRRIQMVLGIFVATVFYCLVTLLAAGRLKEAGGSPRLTVLTAFLLTCASLFTLVFFIHHMARAIQAPNVIRSVAGELNGVIRWTFRPRFTRPAAGDTPPDEDALPRPAYTMLATRDGYLQAIAADGLMPILADRDIVIRFLARPGDFVTPYKPLAVVHSETDVPAELRARLRENIFIGAKRTSTQDVEFVMMQIVEIATRALSPGINDPFTAVTCIDHIAAAICRIAGWPDAQRCLCTEDGRIRLILDQTDFEGLCDAGFHQIRQHAHNNPAVLTRLVEALDMIAHHTTDPARRDALWKHATMVNRAAQRFAEPNDRADVELRCRRLAETLERGAEGEG